jgi:hypothetical protein
LFLLPFEKDFSLIELKDFPLFFINSKNFNLLNAQYFFKRQLLPFYKYMFVFSYENFNTPSDIFCFFSIIDFHNFLFLKKIFLFKFLYFKLIQDGFLKINKRFKKS